METIRWGFLATGKIAHSFAGDLADTPGAELAAVGSRSLESAEAFAREHGVARAHGSYEALVHDPDVDIVYVATPHSMHLEHARMAFEAGKHVLCEKPVTLNVADTEELFALARQHDRFCMEAMWTACHPVVLAVRDGLHAGQFGEPKQLHADLGWRVDLPGTDRMLDPALGGGALLDMGIYPLTLAQMMLGTPDQLTATATLADTGIDLDVAIAGRYGDAVAAITTSMTAWSPSTATIATTTGRIELPTAFHHPPYATFVPHDGEPQTIASDTEVVGRGYGNEALEVQRCLREGLVESPLVPHAQTLAVMRQMDDVRRQIGVTYAADRPPAGE